nr:MAG TPA: hypothetical protein [Caudoviricetes sp.]
MFIFIRLLGLLHKLSFLFFLLSRHSHLSLNDFLL